MTYQHKHSYMFRCLRRRVKNMWRGKYAKPSRFNVFVSVISGALNNPAR